MNQPGGHGHGSAGRGEFNGVGEEIVYHLPEANGIGRDVRQGSVYLQGEVEVLLDGALTHLQDCSLEEVYEGDTLEVQSEFPRLDLAKIKDIVDQGQEVATTTENVLDVPQLFVGEWPRNPFFERLGEPDDGVEGGAKLTGHGGEKFGLGLTSPLKLGGALLHSDFQFLSILLCGPMKSGSLDRRVSRRSAFSLAS